MMYTIDNLRYNGKEVVQVSSEECFEDLAATLEALEAEFRSGSRLEQNMFSLFQEEVEPQAAYRDNDVNQREGGSQRLHVVGKLKRMKGNNGLFVRLGIRAPGEKPLVPALQALYLVDDPHLKCREGVLVGYERDPDRWAYEFTDRYHGMVEGARVTTPLGIQSLGVIIAINEALLNGQKDRELLRLPGVTSGSVH